MSYNNIIKEFTQIDEAHILVNCFEVYIESQRIKINILKDLESGKYSYANSHHYHGTKQAEPYMSSGCSMINSEDEALERAITELTRFYDEFDYDAIWVENEDF